MDGATLDALRAGLGDGGLARLLGRFLDGGPARVDAIRAAYARGAEEELRREAHALRGSAASYGALRLADLCGQLEAGGLSGDVDGLVAAIERELEAMRA